MFSQYDLYLMTTCTALHPGTGRSEFSAIDHLVQRDHRGFPTITKSSMKGALNEHLTSTPTLQTAQKHIFGGNHGKANQLNSLLNKASQQLPGLDSATLEQLKIFFNQETNLQTVAGHYAFQDAELFSIPIRSNVAPFFNVTCPQVLKDFVRKFHLFEIKDNEGLQQELLQLMTIDAPSSEGLVLFTEEVLDPDATIYLEDFTIKAESQLLEVAQFPHLTKWLDRNLVIVSNQIFQQLVDNHHLPIIPRNAIKNGQSKQLWYEQVLPPETRFYTFWAYPINDPYLDDFTSTIDKKLVNIGANLTVGYGRCYFEKSYSRVPQNTLA